MQVSWRGVTFLLVGSTAISFSAEGHLVAFAPLQLRALGLSEPEVGVWSGVLFAVTIATSLPLGPIWGVLAEKFSRRAIILRSYLVLAGALLVAAWAPDLHWLVVSRALVGLSFGIGGVVAATQAMLTPANRVGRAVAAVQAAQPIAASLGPPLGALVIPHYGVSGLFVLDAAFELLSTLVVALLLPEPTGGHRPRSVFGRVAEIFGIAWTTRPIRWNFVNQFLVRGATTVVDTYLPVRIAEVAADPAAMIGWVLGAYGALTTFVTWLVGRLVERFDPLRLYAISMLLGVTVTFGLAVAPWLWLIALLAILRAVPTAFSRPILLTHLARVVPREHQTGVFGLFPTASNCGALLFPLAASAAASLGTGLALGTAGFIYGLTSAAGIRLGRVVK